MINTFLKAKHWQLFLLVFILPFIIYIGWLISFMGNIINEAYYESSDFPAEMFNSISTMLVLMIIPVAIQYAWFWSMAIGLQKKIPESVKMPVSLFKVFFIIPIVYFLLYILFMISLFSNIENIEQLENLEDSVYIGWFFVGIFFFLLLSLFVAFCSFYQFWFIAKTIKVAELQKDVKFGEYVGEFFLVWFYFIGVWILQPTVNKLVSGELPEGPN